MPVKGLIAQEDEVILHVTDDRPRLAEEARKEEGNAGHERWRRACEEKAGFDGAGGAEACESDASGE